MPPGFSYRWIPQLQDLEPNELQDRATKTNFVFRVFDDTSKAVYTKETGFTACTPLGGDFRDRSSQDLHRSVVSHVGRAQINSPWISASRLWDWAVWEMSRRQRRSTSNTHVRVAVIDVRKFKSSSGLDFDPACIHALQFLNPLKEQSDYLKKLENFANIADEILFYGSIPACAVVSVVELEDVVQGTIVNGLAPHRTAIHIGRCVMITYIIGGGTLADTASSVLISPGLCCDPNTVI
ncbi:hypothetical protein FRC12_014676 [Ceratobasidium sp. 428]|nr:hypothetical protein FRC12_014676 [Ceratobasidium sp. 428]